jgi:hypothetical protein
MNTKLRIAFLASFGAITGSFILWSTSFQHSYAAEPRTQTSEQFKIVYITNTGEDAEAELNKASAAGWIFKAVIGEKAVLFTK